MFNQSLDNLPDHVAVVRSLRGLERIFDPTLNLVIFPREENRAITDYVRKLGESFSLHGLHSGYTPENLREFFSGSQEFIDTVLEQDAVFEDIVRQYGYASPGRFVRAYSRLPEDNSQLHRDGVELKMVCSVPYGMVWVENQHAQRVMGKMVDEVDQVLVRQFGSNWVGLHKGTNGQKDLVALTHSPPPPSGFRVSTYSTVV